MLVTSTTEGGRRLFSPLSVCLSVCEQDILKSYVWWTDFAEVWWTCWVCAKDELMRFR